MERVKPKKQALLVLFLTSYIPLFVLLILRQIKQNQSLLYFGGFNSESMNVFLTAFGLSLFLTLLILYGLFGLHFFLRNLQAQVNDGNKVKITEVENKNTDAIAYISTYIVPFIFSDTKDFFDLVSILIVLLFIYFIYTRSSMIVINPILNTKYTVYNITYETKGKRKKGMLISQNNNLETDDEIKINQLTHNMFYG